MGLDLELFVDEVPEDLICATCRKVVVNPVQSTCNHLFCRACLQQSLKTEGSTCPTCDLVLKHDPQQPSLEVKVKINLLNLLIRCTHKCGKVCTLAELPDHASEECPNAPVTCPHVKRGCRMSVKRAELEEHVEECDYRHVQCEACGQRTLFLDLFTHQSRKRCVENKLRQQLIKAVKITNTEVKLHRRHIDRQHLRLEQQQRQRMMDHHRQTTAASSARGLRHRNNHITINRGINGYNSSRNGSEYDSPSFPSTENVSSSMDLHVPHNRDVFLTSTKVENDDEEEGSERAVALHTPAPSRSSTSVGQCRHCQKMFRESLNLPNSCRWHAGPIIELFGGTCYACGRLDYQKGCMMGYHEL